MTNPISKIASEPMDTTIPEARLTEHAVSVLLVDDQRIIGEAVRRMLATDPSIRYEFCDDPTRALEVAKTFQPTVILSDLVMPQMDGLDLVRRLRADEALGGIPLIVLSSKEEPTTKAEAFALGANDYVVKLPDAVELVARIRYHSKGYIHMLQRNEAFDALVKSQGILKDDIDQAANYVRSLLPGLVEAGAVRTRWTFIPSESLGGDAFGYQWIDDDHFVMFLLDVSGHGVGAALLSVSVLNLLNARSIPKTDFRDPGQVISGLNEAFRMNQQGGRYFTIWYGVFQASTRTLRYAGGGHPAAMLFKPGVDAVELLESTGTIPGIFTGVTYDTLETKVAQGARLLVFSDGLYELPLRSGEVATYDSLVGDLAADPDAWGAPLDHGVARAKRLVATDGFPDDVSVFEVLFDGRV